jgi:O-antigen polymerase
MSLGPLTARIDRGALVPVLAVVPAAVAGVLVALVQPDPVPIGVAALALLPLAALVTAGVLRAATVTAALTYVAVLVMVYPEHVAPTYAYAHLIDASPGREAVLIVCALGVAPALWLSADARRPSTILLWVLYLVGYIPAMVVSLYLTGDIERVLPYDVALLGAMAIAGLLARLPPVSISVPRLSVAAFTRLLVVLGIVSLIYTAASFGIHPPPSLADVYGTRARFASEIPASLGGGYIVPWAANAINPLLMALGIARRRVGLVALGLTGQLLIYSDTGFKTTIFSIVLVPAVYLAVSLARRSFTLVATLAASAVFLLAVIPPLASRESLALATRTYVTPAQITWYYYDYFSVHPPYHLSHSVLRGFVRRPYAQEPPELIGPIYFAPEHPHANADLWADAFANFRFAGIAGFSAVFGAMLLIADGLGRRRDLRVAGPMLAITGLSLSNSGLFTTILTTGFGLGCVLMAVMPPMSRRRVRTTAAERRAAGRDRPHHTARTAAAPGDVSSAPLLER